MVYGGINILAAFLSDRVYFSCQLFHSSGACVEQTPGQKLYCVLVGWADLLALCNNLPNLIQTAKEILAIHFFLLQGVVTLLLLIEWQA